VFCSILNVCRVEDAAIFERRRVKSTTGALLVSDRTNSPLNPTRGTLLTLEGRFAGQAIGSDGQIEFAKGVGEFASYHPVGRRAVFAWRVRWGSIRSTDLVEPQDVRFVPPEERFYGGGSNTVRGFRQNELGPLVHVEETDAVFDDADSLLTTIVRTLVSPTGGNQMVFGNVELRFPLSVSGRVGGVVFVDAGQVFLTQTAGNTPGIRVTPGVGIRIFTPLGPVRFDLGYNPHGSEKGPLFTRACETRPNGRTCDPEAVLKQLDFSRPSGKGLFGLGKQFGFLRRIRVNFSIGQAF
jgi:outer membrane protein assembly factor BamA